MKGALLGAALLGAAPAGAVERLAPRRDAAPVALAVEMAFGPAFWAEVKLSTSGPVADLTHLSARGFYKLELIELVLLSAKSGAPLKDLAKGREKGEAMDELSRRRGVDPVRLYRKARAVEEIVDRDYLPRFPERRPIREREE